LLLAGLVAGHADAQVPTSRRVAAEALFDSGLSHMREGQFAEGCAQLEQSLGLDRAVGAMMYLAECYERLGRVASAWLMFREAASQARAEGQMERSQTSEQRAAQLEPKLPRLVVRVSAPNSVSGLTIELNGEKVPDTAWGVPLPVDPGDNQVDAHAPGYRAFSVKQQLAANGETVVVQVPALAVAPNTPAAPAAAISSPLDPPPSAAPATQPRALPLQDDESSSASWQKPVAIGAAGAGLVALGIGTYFGVHAISLNDAAEKLCPNPDNHCDDSRGLAYSSDANQAANLANVFLIGGGVLAATGIVLWLTAPSADEPAASVRMDGRTLALQLTGAF
jgi:serine/threonine-protein kinase